MKILNNLLKKLHHNIFFNLIILYQPKLLDLQVLDYLVLNKVLKDNIHLLLISINNKYIIDHMYQKIKIQIHNILLLQKNFMILKL